MGTPQAIASLHLLIQRLAHAEAEGGSVTAYWLCTLVIDLFWFEYGFIARRTHSQSVWTWAVPRYTLILIHSVILAFHNVARIFPGIAEF
jgi:hypothetical protein